MKYIIILFILLSSFTFADITLVKVIKSERKMYLMDGEKVIKEYHVALGAHPKGHKQKEGDERTPEGTYILDYKNEKSSFHRSMHISYPNKQDKANAKKRGVSPGGFIMIHGQHKWMGWIAPITQRFNWTDGCIALKNSEMDEFMRLVKVGTPIEIKW